MQIVIAVVAQFNFVARINAWDNLGARGFFFLLFQAKIERRSRDREKKPLAARVRLGGQLLRNDIQGTDPRMT